MYKPRDDWSETLRQGDVFGEIAYPLVTNQATLNADIPLYGAAGGGQDSIRIPFTQRLAVVVSHCCEFNPGKRSNFLMARVESMNTHKMTPDEIALLKTGNDYEKCVAEGKPIQLDTFVLDPIADSFTELRRVNLQTICSYPIAFVDEMVKLKKAELADEHRELFRKKLAMFFARPSEPETEAAAVESATDAIAAVEDSNT